MQFSNTQFKQHLKSGAQNLNIPVSDEQIDLMARHAGELFLWNKKINLTAIKETSAVAEKHFLDCLAATFLLKGKQTLLDVGSGGGFPGIPLKIMNPDLEVLLVDASRKKVNFLKHVIRVLGLKQIDAVHARVEDLANDITYKAGFDTVISRAFSDLSEFVALAGPFLKPGACIHAMKGPQARNEMKHTDLIQFNMQTHQYELPFEKSERFILTLVQKP